MLCFYRLSFILSSFYLALFVFPFYTISAQCGFQISANFFHLLHLTQLRAPTCLVDSEYGVIIHFTDYILPVQINLIEMDILERNSFQISSLHQHCQASMHSSTSQNWKKWLKCRKSVNLDSANKGALDMHTVLSSIGCANTYF